MTITAEQVRSARAYLRMEQLELSDISGVSISTIRRIEALTGEINSQAPTIDALRSALEARGVVFTTETDEFGPGVKTRKAAPFSYAEFVDRVAAASTIEEINAVIAEAKGLRDRKDQA